jgi:hypothetical protein
MSELNSSRCTATNVRDDTSTMNKIEILVNVYVFRLFGEHLASENPRCRNGPPEETSTSSVAFSVDDANQLSVIKRVSRLAYAVNYGY